MQHRFFILGCFCLFVVPLHAADIYRWIDKHGQTQLSDKVPEEYREVAEKIGSRRFELTPEQRVEAQARATQERDRVARAVSESDAREQLRMQRAKEAEELAKANSANDSKSAPTDCATQWQTYNASEACFAPYRLANGGIKPEAFQNCVEVRIPSRCPIRTAP